MRKRLIRGLILGAAGMMMLALGTAHAGVSVDISNANGSTVYSLPGLPEGMSYPGGVETRVSGTSGFDSNAGSVLYQITSGNITVFSGQAALNEAGTAWSFRVPFVMGPGTYHVTVTASQPNAQDPEQVDTATDEVDLQVV